MTCGTDYSYVSGCRCLACCDAHRDYKRDVRGNPHAHGFVDAALVLPHLARLRRHLTDAEIVSRSGIAECTLRRLRLGQTKRVWRSTLDALAGVSTGSEPMRRADFALDINAVESALIESGIESPELLMEAAGLNPRTYWRAKAGARVTEDTAERIARALGVRTFRVASKVVSA